MSRHRRAASACAPVLDRLDFGVRKLVPERDRLRLARVCVVLRDEDPDGLAGAVVRCGELAPEDVRARRTLRRVLRERAQHDLRRRRGDSSGRSALGATGDTRACLRIVASVVGASNGTLPREELVRDAAQRVNVPPRHQLWSDGVLEPDLGRHVGRSSGELVLASPLRDRERGWPASPRSATRTRPRSRVGGCSASDRSEPVLAS